MTAPSTFSSLDRLLAALDELGERGIVIGSVGNVIAPGWAASLMHVPFHPEKDTYRAESKRGLSKALLDQLAAAAGLMPVPEGCRRIDSGREPHLCAYRYEARLRDLDGQWRPSVATREIDLRDGSATVEQMEAQAKRSGKDISGALAQQRAHIVSLAESKARNRAIRQALSLPAGYEPAALAKGVFIVVRASFIGRFGDAETDRAVALMASAAALGISLPPGLFGVSLPPAPQAAPALPPPEVFEALDYDSAPPAEAPPEDSLPPSDGFEDLDDADLAQAVRDLAATRGRVLTPEQTAGRSRASLIATYRQIEALPPTTERAS